MRFTSDCSPRFFLLFLLLLHLHLGLVLVAVHHIRLALPGTRRYLWTTEDRARIWMREMSSGDICQRLTVRIKFMTSFSPSFFVFTNIVYRRDCNSFGAWDSREFCPENGLHWRDMCTAWCALGWQMQRDETSRDKTLNYRTNHEESLFNPRFPLFLAHASRV